MLRQRLAGTILTHDIYNICFIPERIRETRISVRSARVGGREFDRGRGEYVGSFNE